MEQIDVKILDRDYRLSVSPEDKDRLVAAAAMVDGKMRSIRDAGRITSADRIAVLAALQFAHQILGEGDGGAAGDPEAGRRLRRINDTLAEELRRQKDLF